MKDEGLMRMADRRPGAWVILGLALVLVWIGASAPVMAVSVAQVPNPRVQQGWVSDTIDILPAAMESEMNAKLSALERETGIEIAVVTVESVDAPTPKDFATELFNVWGIGKQSSNNGLLILLVRGERRLEMETGYGLEAALSDGWLKRMQTEKMVPHFKAERYDLGLEAGVDAVLVRLRQSPEEIVESQSASGFESGATRNHGDSGESDSPWWAVGFGVAGTGSMVLGLLGQRYLRRRERTCPTCRTPMEMVPEDEDDVYLNSGQIAEEQLKSVDYQFYHCVDCGFKRRLVVSKWFSGYSKCRRCSYKTLSTTTRMLRVATTVSTGLKEITEDCKHCRYHHKREVIIPRVTRSSGGGGGGGGGSFGGGSSGGGGAGSSW